MKHSVEHTYETSGLSDLCIRVLGWFRVRIHPDNRLIKKLCNIELLDVGLGILAIWLLLGWITIRLDPFGLGRVSDYHSERIIDRVTSPFYESEGQDEIAVVLIDEDTLAAEEIGWPPSYDYYSQTIYRIMRHDPKAIFMDILLESERPAAIESLPLAREDLADYMEEFRIPVVFAQSEQGARNLFGDIPGIKTALSGWHGSDYPLMVFPEDQGNADGASKKQMGYPTVAMQLHTITHPSSRIDTTTPASLVTQWGCAAPALAKEKDVTAVVLYTACVATATLSSIICACRQLME